MIDFTQETYQNILRQMLDRVPDTYDKRDTSPIPTALGPAAWVFEGFYLSLNQVQQPLSRPPWGRAWTIWP